MKTTDLQSLDATLCVSRVRLIPPLSSLKALYEERHCIEYSVVIAFPTSLCKYVSSVDNPERLCKYYSVFACQTVWIGEILTLTVSIGHLMEPSLSSYLRPPHGKTSTRKEIDTIILTVLLSLRIQLRRKWDLFIRAKYPSVDHAY